MKYITMLLLLIAALCGYAQTDSTAVIATTDGHIYRGKLYKLEVDKSATIIEDGRAYILDWSMIKSIESSLYNIGVAPKTNIDTTKALATKQLSAKQQQIRKSREVSNFYYRKPHYLLGFSAGWGAPYGLGLEFSVLFKGYVDLNTGFGFDMGGFRTGGGFRLFLLGRRKFNPLFAATVAYNSGLGYRVNYNGTSEERSAWAGVALHIRGGLRINTTKASVLLNAGYGIRLAHYGNGRGTPFPPITDAASTFGAGGIEFSMDVLFRIKSKYYSFKDL